MPIKDSESHELIQIEMAAKGHVSGTLAEWPHLKHALRKRGTNLPDTANAQEMRAACCRQLGAELDLKEIPLDGRQYADETGAHPILK